jgi:dynein heavy chain
MELAGSGGGGEGEGDVGLSPDEQAQAMTLEILEEVQEKKYPVDEISRSMSDEEKGPYQYVFLQECESMEMLLYEMVRGLQELVLGFKGELTMSEQMENLKNNLFMQKLPYWWEKLGFPSTRPLSSWRVNLQERFVQIDDWLGDMVNIPKATDIAKLFKPQSFLTAIKQVTCQTLFLELDKLMVFTDVTKREPSKPVDAAAKEGVFVQGLFLEGARWDMASNSVEDSKPKEMAVLMPIFRCFANLIPDKPDKNSYICPTYCVPIRRPWFVFPAQLKTKYIADKWVLAGVAMILDMPV